jgi:hypothetical protein
MKSKLVSMLAVTLFLAIMVFSGSAFAGFPGLGIGAQEAFGNIILFSYYDIRTTAQGGPGLSDNYFTIVNRDEDAYTNAHVRVRTGQCSVELLDFDVLLSPGDVFTFDLYQTATGSTQFASCDTDTLVASGFNVDSNGCYVLDSTTFPDMLGLIETCGNCPDGSGAPLSAADALAATRWGYIEVIGEVELNPDPVADPDDPCSEEKLKAGEYTAWEWITGSDDCGDIGGDGNDNDDTSGYESVDDQLFGRVYYARFDAERNLVRLATSNGLSMVHAVCGGSQAAAHICSNIIIHRPCYQDTSIGCGSGDGELDNDNPFVADHAKYAYEAASTDITQIGTDTTGAKDMNYCSYKDMISGTSVINKVGAAATFGPTLADLNDYIYAPRDGGAGTTAIIIRRVNDFSFAKSLAASHYFYLPGKGQTRYVFTFPFQHFINQSITITKEERFNNKEETCAIPTGKFISPGLPVAGVPRGEVTILATQEPNDTCTFNEGWIEFSVLVTEDGVGDSDYFPGVIGMVVNYGDGDTADVMAIAPLQWLLLLMAI